MTLVRNPAYWVKRDSVSAGAELAAVLVAPFLTARLAGNFSTM